jgi:hypothetical protein
LLGDMIGQGGIYLVLEQSGQHHNGQIKRGQQL